MRRQPDDLRRILADWTPVEAGAGRIAGRRVFVVGTGTSWHAANQGAYFLRLAGVDAAAVSAADCDLWGPRPARADALVLLSHRGTKRHTSQVLERARAEGVATVAIGGVGAPAVDIETVEQETSCTFTASHLGALARLAQLAVTLGRPPRRVGSDPNLGRRSRRRKRLRPVNRPVRYSRPSMKAESVCSPRTDEKTSVRGSD